MHCAVLGRYPLQTHRREPAHAGFPHIAKTARNGYHIDSRYTLTDGSMEGVIHSYAT